MSDLLFSRRYFLFSASALAGGFSSALAADGGSVCGVPAQPYFAAVNRALEAMATLGAPVPQVHSQQIAALARQGDSAAVAAVEMILEHDTLACVTVEVDGFARATAGGAQRTLIEQSWRVFLVRVFNPLGSTNPL